MIYLRFVARGALLAFLVLTGWAQAQNNPVFVLNSLDGNVSVIDPVTWTETQRIPTGKEPHHLYLTPDEKSVIVANALSDSLTFIDPRTAKVQRTVSGILDPYQLRFSPDMKWFVTAANRLNHIDIYRWDGQNATLAKRIATAERKEGCVGIQHGKGFRSVARVLHAAIEHAPRAVTEQRMQYVAANGCASIASRRRGALQRGGLHAFTT